MKTTGRRLLPGLVGLACIGALAACSQGGAPSATPTESLPPGVVVVPAPLGGVAEQYERSESESHEAIQKAITVCMKDKGFDYKPTARDDSRYRELMAERYGDVEAAKTDGLGIMTKTAELLKAAEKQGLSVGDIQNQKPEYIKALYGHAPGQEEETDDPDIIKVKTGDGQIFPIPTKACFFSARKAVTPDLGKYFQDSTTLFELLQKVQTDIEQDNRYKDAEGKWTKCMADAGYESKPRKEYTEDLTKKAFEANTDEKKQEEVRKEEIKIGTSITQCDRDSNLGQVIKDVQAEKEKKIIDDNQGFLAGWKETNDEMVKRAKEYLKQK